MKILIVSTVKYRKNGISSVIENYYTDPCFAGEDVSFLFHIGSDSHMIRRLEDLGHRVYLRNRSMKRVPAYCAELAKLIRQERFDILHVHGNSATMALEMIAARMGGCKIRIAHSHNTTCKHMTIHKLFDPVFQKLCTHRLACGTAAGKWLYGDRKFTVVNNGVDTQRFAFDPDSRERIRRQYGIREDTILIGHVGTFNAQKNQIFLLDVMRNMEKENHRLMLIGDGDLRPDTERRARDLGLQDKVIFTGVISNVPEYLCACDYIAMPSLYEGLPLTLIEEQANGLRCIVSEHITKEADKTGNLTFLPLGDGAQWAGTIRELPETDREALSRSAIEKISACGYDIHAEAAKLKAYYEQAVKEG